MNTRRNLLIVLGTAPFTPRAVFAQAKKAPVVIGWLHEESQETGRHWLGAFKEGLAGLGWKVGSQVVIEERWADGRHDRLQPLAEELAARKPAAIVASPTRSVTAAAKAAPKIPIVMVTGGDPVAAGVVASLARPGGMITGVTGISADLTEKFLELLLVAAPKLKRVGVLNDPRNPNRVKIMDAVRRSAVQYAVEVRFAEATTPEEIERAVLLLKKDGVQALVVTGSVMFYVERRRIVKAALAQGWPVVAGRSEYVDEGALLSSGADRLVLYRRTAYYVDRILKGTKPGDLPIEQPMKIDLVVNAKTAKLLGLTLPPEIMVRAEKVIQ